MITIFFSHCQRIFHGMCVQFNSLVRMSTNLQTRPQYENVHLDTSTEGNYNDTIQGNSVSTGQSRGYQNVSFNFQNSTHETRHYDNVLDDQTDSTVVQARQAQKDSNGVMIDDNRSYEPLRYRNAVRQSMAQVTDFTKKHKTVLAIILSVLITASVLLSIILTMRLV